MSDLNPQDLEVGHQKGAWSRSLSGPSTIRTKSASQATDPPISSLRTPARRSPGRTGPPDHRRQGTPSTLPRAARPACRTRAPQRVRGDRIAFGFHVVEDRARCRQLSPAVSSEGKRARPLLTRSPLTHGTCAVPAPAPATPSGNPRNTDWAAAALPRKRERINRRRLLCPRRSAQADGSSEHPPPGLYAFSRAEDRRGVCVLWRCPQDRPLPEAGGASQLSPNSCSARSIRN